MSRRPSVEFDLVDVCSEEEEEEEEEDERIPLSVCLSVCLFRRIPSQPAADSRLSGEARSRSGILWNSPALSGLKCRFLRGFCGSFFRLPPQKWMLPQQR
ncbi:hypothetical protein SRHO_G00201410 [Serrasalmus rhombeus]